MREYRITEINRFMAILLKGEGFDGFLLKDALIRTFMDFRFEGELHKDFYDTDEREGLNLREYALWRDVKQTAFDLIKGKHTPLAMEFKLMASKEATKALIAENGIKTGPDEVIHLNLNIVFRDGVAKAVTGLYRSGLSLDRELDRVWDENVGKFLKQIDVM